MVHLFIVNRDSLGSKLDKCIGNITNICDSNALQYKVFITDSIQDMQAKVHSCKAYENAVYYAVGGDGTFQPLVNAVDLDNVVLQYLPYGSGNNAYITFYNRPFDLKRDILCTDIFKADLGQANGEYFITMFGLALDSAIGNNLSKFRWLPFSGKAKYYASIFYTLLFDSKPVKVRMTVDGVEEDRVSSFISITNGPTTGGQTPISPHSSAFDGKLNALAAEKSTFFQSLKLFSKVKTGNHLNDPGVSQYLFEELLFESDEALRYEIDGEIHFSNHIDIKVCKNAITLKGKSL